MAQSSEPNQIAIVSVDDINFAINLSSNIDQIKADISKKIETFFRQKRNVTGFSYLNHNGKTLTVFDKYGLEVFLRSFESQNFIEIKCKFAIDTIPSSAMDNTTSTNNTTSSNNTRCKKSQSGLTDQYKLYPDNPYEDSLYFIYIFCI